MCTLKFLVIKISICFVTLIPNIKIIWLNCKMSIFFDIFIPGESSVNSGVFLGDQKVLTGFYNGGPWEDIFGSI